MKKSVKQNDSLYRTVTKANYKPLEGRKFSQDSMTIPDDSLSVKQLLINHTRGLGVVPTRQGIYTGDTVAPRYTDLNDRKNAVDELRQKIEFAKKQIQEEKTRNQAQASHDPGVAEMEVYPPSEE